MAIEVFHNTDGKEEFGEKPFITVKKTPVCEFMKTFYKEKLYDKIKDYSNLPNPEECPVKAVSLEGFEMIKFNSKLFLLNSIESL